MKYSLFFILIIGIIFSSCDGRHRAKDSLKESVTEFNKTLNQQDKITHYPKQYTEVVTDTIISNTLKVSIKNYSLMDKNVVISDNSKNGQVLIDYQRVFESTISISDTSKIFFKTTISANAFRNDNDDFWKNTTLEHTWLNEELSNTKAVFIEFSFINPKRKTNKTYRMLIDRNGNNSIHLLKKYS
jgi:hypothetical protein